MAQLTFLEELSASDKPCIRQTVKPKAPQKNILLDRNRPIKPLDI